MRRSGVNHQGFPEAIKTRGHLAQFRLLTEGRKRAIVLPGWAQIVEPVMYETIASTSKTVTVVLAVFVLGATATASARPKKDSAPRPSSATTLCHGTPVIMQGLDCTKPPARA